MNNVVPLHRVVPSLLGRYLDEDWDGSRAMPSARATHASHRTNLRCFGLSVGIAIAAVSMSGCSRHGSPFPVGEATATSYQMADLLAGDETPSGALARRGLADGYLSASEADGMWDAYHAEKRASAAAEKATIIKRWKRPVSKGGAQ